MDDLYLSGGDAKQKSCHGWCGSYIVITKPGDALWEQVLQRNHTYVCLHSQLGNTQKKMFLGALLALATN